MGWTIRTEKMTQTVTLAIIDIETLDDDLIFLIDNTIISICHGKNFMENDINGVKKKLYDNLVTDDQIDSDVKRGAIAEFFVHLYLNTMNYKQECFFLNMEESRSIKKGFDGFYTFENKEWVMESKSGASTTQSLSHHGKLKEAYNDLKNKFLGNVNNNPWENAYSHAGHYDIQTKKKTLDKIKECKKKFDNNEPVDISDFRLIPSSTIFMVGDNFVRTDFEPQLKKISEYVEKLNYKELLLVCITNYSESIFVEYLRSL